jgi:carboxypeptidase family protein
MCELLKRWSPGVTSRPCILLRTIASILMLTTTVVGQTASTGAFVGEAFDPSGAVMPGASFRVVNESTRATRYATSDAMGRFAIPLLSPGKYEVEATSPGSPALVAHATIDVSVTETVHLTIHLQPATVFQSVKVSAEANGVQTESSTLGKAINERSISNFPLVTRNFAQNRKSVSWGHDWSL